MPKTKKSAAATDEERINALQAAVSEEEGNENVKEETTEESEEKQEEHVEEVDETEDNQEENKEEVDDEGLPVDNKARSDLGRKLAALHRRQDEFDEKFSQLIDAMMNQNAPKEESEEIDPDEPLTRSQLLNILNERDQKKTKTEQQYNDQYLKALSVQSADMEQNQIDAIVEEMKTITYTPTDDPKHDAEVNWLKAERAYLRKLISSKDGEIENPLKGVKPKSPLGVIKNQKTVVRETALPKLDEAAKTYLDFVRVRSGDEQATKLHRSIAKAE